jgi:hypothetical protein
MYRPRVGVNNHISWGWVSTTVKIINLYDVIVDESYKL